MSIRVIHPAGMLLMTGPLLERVLSSFVFFGGPKSCRRVQSMDNALILISVFAIFIPALIMPGPDFVAVVRSSMTYGTRAGLLTTLGVSMGLCLYATLSLLGLSAILAEYQR